jgi:hypothetical protein
MLSYSHVQCAHSMSSGQSQDTNLTDFNRPPVRPGRFLRRSPLSCRRSERTNSWGCCHDCIRGTEQTWCFGRDRTLLVLLLGAPGARTTYEVVYTRRVGRLGLTKPCFQGSHQKANLCAYIPSPPASAYHTMGHQGSCCPT